MPQRSEGNEADAPRLDAASLRDGLRIMRDQFTGEQLVMMKSSPVKVAGLLFFLWAELCGEQPLNVTTEIDRFARAVEFLKNNLWVQDEGKRKGRPSDVLIDFMMVLKRQGMKPTEIARACVPDFDQLGRAEKARRLMAIRGQLQARRKRQNRKSRKGAGNGKGPAH